MRNPVVIHVQRPYADEREYLLAEAWTIDDRGMFLIADQELAPDTAVVFDIALANGIKVIRAEGRVEHFVPQEGSHPAGLRVRFRRYGAQTKAFIDRALGHSERRSAAPATQRSITGSIAPPSSVSPSSVSPSSVAPRSLTPPPVPVRSSRPAAGPASERAPLSSRDATVPSRPPPLPRRSLTPPAGTPLPFEALSPTLDRAKASNRPRVRAEAEPILPAIVPASRNTLPGLGDELEEPPSLAEPPAVVEASAPAESRAPPTPSAGSLENLPSSQPSESEPSGVHPVAGTGVTLARPQNRDELLKRLRERTRSPDSAELDASAGSGSEG
jgi:hypothetical protein